MVVGLHFEAEHGKGSLRSLSDFCRFIPQIIADEEDEGNGTGFQGILLGEMRKANTKLRDRRTRGQTPLWLCGGPRHR